MNESSIAAIVKRARDHSYVRRITREQEKATKDIGGILVPSAFQVPNEVVDDE